MVWLAILFEGRAPSTLHRFIASFVRYTVHVGAYVNLAAGPYPGFTGQTSYPVDVEIDPPSRQSRKSAGFRLVLAIPALILATALGGSFGTGFPSYARTGGETGLRLHSSVRCRSDVRDPGLVRVGRPWAHAARLRTSLPTASATARRRSDTSYF